MDSLRRTRVSDGLTHWELGVGWSPFFPCLFLSGSSCFWVEGENTKELQLRHILSVILSPVIWFHPWCNCFKWLLQNVRSICRLYFNNLSFSNRMKSSTPPSQTLTWPSLIFTTSYYFNRSSQDLKREYFRIFKSWRYPVSFVPKTLCDVLNVFSVSFRKK